MFKKPYIRPERKLIGAVSKGDLQEVNDLIEDRVDINYQNEDGSSALLIASELGYVGFVEVLLKCGGINVNLQNKLGNTALLSASIHGHSDIVKALLRCGNIDVNLSNIFGDTALIWARANGYIEIVKYLEDFEKKSVTGVDEVIMQSRAKLLHAMTDSSYGPVEISLEYVDHCITDKILGEGAFGIVYLANDSKLPKKFAIKKIKLTNDDEKGIRDIYNNFNTEISALKRFHHPNIIVMYGYALSDHHTQQCLFYEYAANGSLDIFLKSNSNRACLQDNIRLSIMLDITKAVHFLHTGGCKGYVLYHRDIKSANICLTEDFTAQLIDCGLAKFVRIDGSPTTAASVTNYFSSSNIVGTPGYTCPEYLYKRIKGSNYEYQAACDVYSIGVVMVELIVGCLIAGQSSQSGKTFRDFHQKYVEDDKDRFIPDGWKLLKNDVDPCISWKTNVLDCVCKAAISCLHTSAAKRSTTQTLLCMLNEAICLNAGTGLMEDHKRNSDGLKCDICNQFLSASQKVNSCSEGHSLCQKCMENSILLRLPSGQKAHCPFVSCKSQPFTNEELYGFVSHPVYTEYTDNLDKLTKVESKLNNLAIEINGLQSAINHHNLQNQNAFMMITSELRKFDSLASGMDRALSLLALLGAQHIKVCPNLVWLCPVDVKFANPREWLKGRVENRFHVSFICAHSGVACHHPFEINIPKSWVVKVAPILKLSLLVIKSMASASNLPFPIPDIPTLDQFSLMEAFLDDVIDRNSLMCERIMEQGTVTMETYISAQDLYGNAFDLIAKKAVKEDNLPFWNKTLVPVCDKEKGIIWVMPKYKHLYFIG